MLKGTYDQIWDAIPLYELLDFAKDQYHECCLQPESEMRHCAESIARAHICFCCNSEDSIVNGVTDEILKQLGNACLNRSKVYPMCFEGENKHGN